MNSACFTQGVCFHITYLLTRATSVWRAWCNMSFVPSCIGKRFSHCIIAIFIHIKHFRDCLCPVYKDIVILEWTTPISIKIIIQRKIGFDSKLICIDLGVNASSKGKCWNQKNPSEMRPQTKTQGTGSPHCKGQEFMNFLWFVIRLCLGAFHQGLHIFLLSQLCLFAVWKNPHIACSNALKHLVVQMSKTF